MNDARLGRRAVLAFGCSGFAQNVIGTCLGVHLFMFYTDVVGLAPLWVSCGLVVATLWDAISDVWMGRLSDRTRWRAGRRRPYVLLGAIPAGLAFVLLLAPPAALEGAALGLYFTGALLLLFTATTVVQVPALSLLPEMARDYDDRTRLAASRELLGNVGDLVGLLLPLLLLIALGAVGDDARAGRSAFAWAGGIVGALAIAALLVTHRGTHERPAPERAPSEPGSLRDALRALAGNRAFRYLIGASGLAALGLALVSALILYVLEHVMGETDPAVQLLAFVLNVAGALLSYPFWTWLARTHGKPFAFRVGLVLSSLTFSSVLFLGPGDLALLYAVMIFGGAANVGFWMLTHALSADVVDLDELAHGERREGLFAGFAALIRKGAFGLAAAGVGVGLSVIDYREGAAQTAQTVAGLRLLFAVPPTLLLLGALVVFRRFPLTREVHAEVRARLEGRPVPRPAPGPARAHPAVSATAA